MRTAMPSRKRVPTPCASTADAASRVRQAALRREARSRRESPDGLVKRRFEASGPNAARFADITNFKTRQRGACTTAAEKGGGTGVGVAAFVASRVSLAELRYANSLRPASSSAFSSASAASRLASFANTYSLIFGSVPLGRTMTLLPPSTSNSTTLAEGRPFTPPW